ncbi:MAG: DUF4388 domain-containing protein [Chloroflexota bacterium]
MALKGNLRDFSAAQLLNLISLAHKTGTLTIEGREATRLYFRDGRLIYAEAGDSHWNSLAQILRRAGRLSEEQSLALQVRAQGTGDKQLGHLLVEAGQVTQADIIQSLRGHVLETTYRVFGWPEGPFRFESDLGAAAERIALALDLDGVILEGTRRLKEWKQLTEELPSLDVRLRFPEQPNGRLRDVHLTVEEWRVISLVSPQRTLRQIAEVNQLSEVRIRRIVFGLLQAGLVEMAPLAKSSVSQPPAVPTNRATAAGPTTIAVPSSPPVKRSVVRRIIERIRSL